METSKCLYEIFLLYCHILSRYAIYVLPILEILEWYVKEKERWRVLSQVLHFQLTLRLLTVFSHHIPLVSTLFHWYTPCPPAPPKNIPNLASIWLTCHALECTLEITPPGFKTHTVVFSRTQLIGSQATKVDKLGNFISLDDSKYEPPPRGKDAKKKNSYKKTGAYKGPDDNGHYRSFSLRFHPTTPDRITKTEEDKMDGDFKDVLQFMDKETLNSEGGAAEEIYVLHMRRFGLSQSRIRVRSSINKVESYVKRRRQKLVVKESGPLPWQALLFLIFGILGLILTLLFGQFWNEAPKKQGGPGTRRPQQQSSSSLSARGGSNKTFPTFVVDTGRPSKLPPGYQYQKKY